MNANAREWHCLQHASGLSAALDDANDDGLRAKLRNMVDDANAQAAAESWTPLDEHHDVDALRSALVAVLKLHGVVRRPDLAGMLVEVSNREFAVATFQNKVYDFLKPQLLGSQCGEAERPQRRMVLGQQIAAALCRLALDNSRLQEALQVQQRALIASAAEKVRSGDARGASRLFFAAACIDSRTATYGFSQVAMQTMFDHAAGAAASALESRDANALAAAAVSWAVVGQMSALMADFDRAGRAIGNARWIAAHDVPGGELLAETQRRLDCADAACSQTHNRLQEERAQAQERNHSRAALFGNAEQRAAEQQRQLQQQPQEPEKMSD
jgi:hypothetical protein